MTSVLPHPHRLAVRLRPGSRRADAVAFRAAWEAALALSYDRLEEAALGRALHGVPVPIVHGANGSPNAAISTNA